MKNGNPVDAEDKSKWQVGDLVFPHAGHVVTYIGDDKFIAAPQTGENVKIQGQYWQSTYAVRRVIPEDTTTSSNTGNVDLSNATQISMDLSFYAGASDEGGNESASGKTLQYGMCASNYYPFGTKFYIEGINGLPNGTFTVEDTGSDSGFKTTIATVS